MRASPDRPPRAAGFLCALARVAGSDGPVSFRAAGCLEHGADRLRSAPMRVPHHGMRSTLKVGREPAVRRSMRVRGHAVEGVSTRPTCRARVRRRACRVRALSRNWACATRNRGLSGDFFLGVFVTPKRPSSRPSCTDAIVVAITRATERLFANPLNKAIC